MTQDVSETAIARQKASALLEAIGHVMLVTHDAEGGLRARPMRIIAIEGDCVWFFTDVDSPKSMEIGRDHDVLLAAAAPDRREYVSVAGRARVIQDAEMQRRLWTEEARPWFPEGARSEDLALIEVRMQGAEFWDGQAGGGYLAFSYIQAMRAEAGEDTDHAKVRF